MRVMVNEPTRQPTVMAVPTRLNMKLGKGCRARISLQHFMLALKSRSLCAWLELCSPLISAMNTQGHRNPNSAREKDLHFHTMSSNPAELYFLAGAKFAYVLLNTPTACPPRTAVPVNRPFFSRCRCWAVVFGFEFGQVCDFPNDVRPDCILVHIRFAIHNYAHRPRRAVYRLHPHTIQSTSLLFHHLRRDKLGA